MMGVRFPPPALMFIDFILNSFWLLPVLLVTTVWHVISCYKENRCNPPGTFVGIQCRKIHLLHLSAETTDAVKQPTVVIDHSLGGVEGYLLIGKIAQFANVCLCDRAGYGWSDIAREAPTSSQSISDLDIALTEADIEPPYILVGDSLGSYNMRLYTHRFPEKVVGMVLTDGLHEEAMLKMSLGLRFLQLFFLLGFAISILGSALGIVRACATFGIFTLIKPQLRKFSTANIAPVLRSFCRSKHWLTMAREIISLDRSGQQLRSANEFGALPIVNIKSLCFLDLGWLNKIPPLRTADQLRDDMHNRLMQLSSQCRQVQAERSSHFVWIDQPELIVSAVRSLMS